MGPLTVTGTLDGDALKGSVNIGQEIAFEAARLPTVETPVSGAWKVYLPDFDATVDLSLSVGEDGVLRGWFKSTSSDSPLYGGTWDEKTQTVTFEYDYPHAGRLPVEAKLVDGVLKGTIGEGTTFSGKRAPADG